jgi:hypothetical protein
LQQKEIDYTQAWDETIFRTPFEQFVSFINHDFLLNKVLVSTIVKF